MRAKVRKEMVGHPNLSTLPWRWGQPSFTETDWIGLDNGLAGVAGGLMMCGIVGILTAVNKQEREATV